MRSEARRERRTLEERDRKAHLSTAVVHKRMPETIPAEEEQNTEELQDDSFLMAVCEHTV